MKTKIIASGELKPHTSQKSYYGKARVTYYNDGSCILTSYDTDVCKIDKGNNFVKLWDGYSRTTMKHINSFLALIDYTVDGKKDWDHFIVNRPYPLVNS